MKHPRRIAWQPQARGFCYGGVDGGLKGLAACLVVNVSEMAAAGVASARHLNEGADL